MLEEIATFVRHLAQSFNETRIESSYKEFPVKEYAYFAAASRGDVPALRYFSKFVDVNVKTDPFYNERTALHLAAYNGHTEAVDFLIKLGADIDQPNNEGETALHRAIISGKTEVACLLIKLGADLNKQNDNGETPFYLATIRQRYEIVRYAFFFPGFVFDPSMRDALTLNDHWFLRAADQQGDLAFCNKLLNHIDVVANYQEPQYLSVHPVLRFMASYGIEGPSRSCNVQSSIVRRRLDL